MGPYPVNFFHCCAGPAPIPIFIVVVPGRHLSKDILCVAVVVHQYPSKLYACCYGSNWVDFSCAVFLFGVLFWGEWGWLVSAKIRRAAAGLWLPDRIIIRSRNARLSSLLSSREVAEFKTLVAFFES